MNVGAAEPEGVDPDAPRRTAQSTQRFGQRWNIESGALQPQALAR